MVDSKTIEDVIKDNIRQSVDSYVTTILSEDAWITALESRIIKHVQDRITARFANIGTMPDLVETVKTSVIMLMESGHIPGLDHQIDAQRLKSIVDNNIQVLVTKAIDNLVLDQTWLEKVENVINQEFQRKFGAKLSTLDVDLLIKNNIDEGFHRWRHLFGQDFESRGIKDQATSGQLTITDRGVIARDLIDCGSIKVDNDANIAGTLTVKNLAVRGSINTDNESWQELIQSMANETVKQMDETWRKQLTQDVLDLAKQGGIDFQSVMLNGRPLIDGDRLNHSIKVSNIEALGHLRELKVVGPAEIYNTMTVTQGRVGINNATPEMALGVWDDEVSIIIGKHSQNRAFVGTSRSQALSLGVNREPMVDIDADGMVTVKQFRINQHRIGFDTKVPGYSGTRGDVIFNSDPQPGQPFAWQCLGGFKWQTLRALT